MNKQPTVWDIIESEEKDKARSLYKNTSDIIYAHDLEWTVISVNPTTKRILGYTAEDLIGKNILTIIHSDREQYLLTGKRRIREGNGVC